MLLRYADRVKGLSVENDNDDDLGIIEELHESEADYDDESKDWFMNAFGKNSIHIQIIQYAHC